MCGIVGLFCKSPELEPRLGEYLSAMLVQMNDRGPDSAGVAFYREPAPEGWCRVSLHGADADWEARYRALRARCETRFQHAVLGPPAPGEDAFERNNLWCLDTAQALVPPDRVHAILVWDEKPTGDGLGGTAHFAARVAKGGGRVSVINPTKL